MNSFLETEFWWGASFHQAQGSRTISFISQLTVDTVEFGGLHHSRVTKFRYQTTCWSALLQTTFCASAASLHSGFCYSAEEAFPSAQWRGPGCNLGTLQT